MKRPARALVPLLGIVLLLQVVLAPLHCLAMARSAGGLEAILCSPGGTRVIHVDADGRELPADDGAGAACFICADTARAVLPEPLRLAGPRDIPAGHAWHTDAADYAQPPARAPPYAPRGPPNHA